MKINIILTSILLLTLPLTAQDLFHNNLQKLLLDEYNATGGSWLFFDQEQEIIESAIHYGGEFSTLNSTGTDFSLKVRSSVQKGENPWNAGWFVENNSTIAKDDILFFTFSIRSLNGVGQVNFFVEHETTFAKEVFISIDMDTIWREFLIPVASTGDYGIKELHAGFHLANETQMLEFGGLTALNFKNEVNLEDLPSKTNIDQYGGFEADAPWRAIAEANIENYRKTNLKINVSDTLGNPIPNIEVSVKMLQHEFSFGSAITANRIAGNNLYNSTYESKITDLDGKGEHHGFSEIVFENSMKWPGWEEEWLVNKDELVDAVDWFYSRDIRVRGHTLVWPGFDNMPSDIEENSSDPEYILMRINSHLETILTYPGIQGKIDEWDVINETVTNQSVEESLMGTEGYETGREIYNEIFSKTRSIDSMTGLWLNDYVTLSLGNTAGDAPYDQFKRNLGEIVASGVDIEGVGFQGHIGGGLLSINEVLDVLDDFYNSFGLKAKVTEFDLPNIVPEELAAQYLRDFLTAIFSHESMDGFLFWSFWDGATYMNPGANLFRNDWTMTPAGDAFVDLLFNEWWTEEVISSSANGLVELRPFKGKFEISYEHDGNIVKDTILVNNDTEYDITIGNATTSNKIYSIEDLSISPNPSNGLFRISSTYPLRNTALQLSDFSGKVLENHMIDNDNIWIDWSKYQGAYLLKFITPNGIDVRKMIFH